MPNNYLSFEVPYVKIGAFLLLEKVITEKKKKKYIIVKSINFSLYAQNLKIRTLNRIQ